MPIKIPNTLPAARILESENIFVMHESRAVSQDIRPLEIVLLNLMPTKIETETQLLRLLGNSPIQVNIELLQMSSHVSKNTPQEHLLTFYKSFDQIKHRRFDGMVITGAPIELMEFEEVDYWPELCEMMEWSRSNVYSTLHICWGAQAGLYYHYGVGKCTLPEKMFGVFLHHTCVQNHRLLRGFDEVFYAPHSRHTGIEPALVEACPKLDILARSDQAGLFLMANRSARRIFVTGHPEYDRMTLANEYLRDATKGLDIKKPVNYFPGDNPQRQPLYTWRGHGNLLYSNWLNYVVYQDTPYDLDRLEPHQ